MPFYAVAKGHKTGIFKTWPECQEQVKGFKCAAFKKFDTEEEAQQFINEKRDGVVDRRKNKDSGSSDKKRKLSSSSDEGGQAKKAKTLDKDNLSITKDGCLSIFTDGCCFFNGNQGAKAGLGVYFGENHPMNISEAVVGRATNNTAEIQAAIKALEAAKKTSYDKILINTDSNFMINCMTKWMTSWKKKGWKTAKGADVVNKEELQKLDKMTEGLLVYWNHIDAHTGIPENEAADKLAKAGAKKYVAPVKSTGDAKDE